MIIAIVLFCSVWFFFSLLLTILARSIAKIIVKIVYVNACCICIVAYNRALGMDQFYYIKSKYGRIAC